MLLTTYNPNCQATCPKCKKLTKSYNKGGRLWGYSDDYLYIKCLECNYEYKTFIYNDRITAIQHNKPW